MPFVTQEERLPYEPMFRFVEQTPPTAGQFTYIVYRIMVIMWRKQPRFVVAALMFGGLVCALLELYRRYIAPHEDSKMRENGDV